MCSQTEPSQGGMPEELLAKVAAARHCEAQQRLERLSQLRDEDRARLANHRLRRERLEQKLHRSRFKNVLPPIQNVAAARETLALIEEFEREIVQTSNRPDTA